MQEIEQKSKYAKCKMRQIYDDVDECLSNKPSSDVHLGSNHGKTDTGQGVIQTRTL